MALPTPHSIAWDLVRRQHGVVTRRQLRDLGLTRDAIQHRIDKGKLHVVHRGVYAVGRPDLARLGTWMAAVLACGPGAVLSHLSAAALWGLRQGGEELVEVSVPRDRCPRAVMVHRRALRPADLTSQQGIPVTSPTCTLIDVAPRLRSAQLERDQ